MAGCTVRLAGLASVAAMQDQPVMGIEGEFGGDGFYQGVLYRFRGFPGGEARAVRDTEDVGIDRHGRLFISHIQYDIRGLSSDTGEFH